MNARFVDDQRRQVGMGQLMVGAHDEQLHAVLGSCVGIAFIWKKGGRCALAHCLLPESPEAGGNDGAFGDVGNFSARYVSQAVPSLLRLMGARSSDYADIDVVLAGGASMFNSHSGRLQVGQQNVAAARKYLMQSGLQVRHSELGGKCGRQILIDCADQSFSISNIVARTQHVANATAASQVTNIIHTTRERRHGNARSAAY